MSIGLPARLGGAALGLGLSFVIDEPPDRLHVLAGFGQCMTQIERVSYANSKPAGVAYSVTGIGVGIAFAKCLDRAVKKLGRNLRPSISDLVTQAASVQLASGALGLWKAALAIQDALISKDLGSARIAARSLVGRDLNGCGPSEISRAAVESVAENTVDAIVATWLFGILLGPKGALGHRVVNTMDALVGYRNERYEKFGWASARMDDAANYLPARVTAGLVMVVRPQHAMSILRAIRSYAPAHPSPNAGVVEVAFATALGLRLGGVNVYGGHAEMRPYLGDGSAPVPSDVGRAVKLSKDVARVAVLATSLFASWLGSRAIRQ